ncbi:MAG TPA: hypothetical protein VGX70_10100 [Gemmataceae bacterium]|nr:hypothetical protein [Gemmataceae bacterium]
MAAIILLLIFVTDIFPFWRAVQDHRQSTLLHSVFWALAALLAWTAAVCIEAVRPEEPASGMPGYLALSLTGCASLAVLGARRPGAVAWNFVILGLLAVMLFLWLEGRLAEDDLILHRVRTVFLASTVAIGVLNYLPTRLAPAAMLLALGCAGELLMISGSESLAAAFAPARHLSRLMVALAPWAAYARIHWQPLPASEVDRLWLQFRNSYGFVWAQRLREQFNQSAKHSDWPVVLRWQGLRVIPGAPPPSSEDRLAMLANLRALMKRFEASEK